MDVPLPDDAMLILPGLALHRRNSATVFIGGLVVSTITFGVRTMPATGAMSRTKLNGSFL